MLTQTLHTFKTGQTFVGATIDGGNLVLGETRNEEQASEGRFNLLTVIPLQEAIAMAKALLASQEADAAYDAFIEAEWERRQDYEALVDDAMGREYAIEDDYEFIRMGGA